MAAQQQCVQGRVVPVVAVTWLISDSLLSGTARRVEGNRRGLATIASGLSASPIRPSAMACGRGSAGEQLACSVTLRPPGVAAGHHMGADVFDQPRHVGWSDGRMVQAPIIPRLHDPVPVRLS